MRLLMTFALALAFATAGCGPDDQTQLEEQLRLDRDVQDEVMPHWQTFDDGVRYMTDGSGKEVDDLDSEQAPQEETICSNGVCFCYAEHCKFFKAVCEFFGGTHSTGNHWGRPYEQCDIPQN